MVHGFLDLHRILSTSARAHRHELGVNLLPGGVTEDHLKTYMIPYHRIDGAIAYSPHTISSLGAPKNLHS